MIKAAQPQIALGGAVPGHDMIAQRGAGRPAVASQHRRDACPAPLMLGGSAVVYGEARPKVADVGGVAAAAEVALQADVYDCYDTR